MKNCRTFANNARKALHLAKCMICAMIFSLSGVMVVATFLGFRWLDKPYGSLKFDAMHSEHPGATVVHNLEFCLEKSTQGKQFSYVHAKPDEVKKFPKAFLSTTQDKISINDLNDSLSGSKYNEVRPSLVLNCWWRPLHDTNPAHWMQALGQLFELGLQKVSLRNDLIRIEAIYFHQCPNPSQSKWLMGELLLQTAILNWAEQEIHWISGFDERYVCFQKGTVVERRPGWSFLSNEVLGDLWRRQAMKNIHGTIKPNHMGHKLRKVGIFQRTSGSALRQFINMNEVITTLVMMDLETEIFTITNSSSVLEQASVFAQYALVISPHGSHLFNFIFDDRRTSYLEVVPGLKPYNHDFQRCAIRLGLQSYSILTGNAVPPSCITCRKNTSCVPTIPSKSSIQCDIIVNVTKLKNAVEDVLMNHKYRFSIL